MTISSNTRLVLRGTMKRQSKLVLIAFICMILASMKLTYAFADDSLEAPQLDGEAVVETSSVAEEEIATETSTEADEEYLTAQESAASQDEHEQVDGVEEETQADSAVTEELPVEEEEEAADSGSQGELVLMDSTERQKFDLDLASSSDTQTKTVTAEKTGFHRISIECDDNDSRFDITVYDASTKECLGSFHTKPYTINGPYIYMVEGESYELILTTDAEEGVEGTFTLICGDLTDDNWYTVDDSGCLTKYSGQALNINVPEGVETISNEVFYEIANSCNDSSDSVYITSFSLNLPKSLKEFYAGRLNHGLDNAKHQPTVSSYSVSDDNPYLKCVDSVIYSKDGTKVIAGPSRSSAEPLVLLEGTTTIGSEAFYRTEIEAITLPQSLTEIDSYAFAKSKLVSIVIPNSVQTIENGAFSDSALKSIDLGSGVQLIQFYAFESTLVESVVIPASVGTVEAGAFENCDKLTNVTVLGTSVVMQGAFEDCDNLARLSVRGEARRLDAFHGCPKLTDFEVSSNVSGWSVEGGSLVKNTYKNGTLVEKMLYLVPALPDNTDYVIRNNIQVVDVFAFDNAPNIGTLTIGKSCATTSYGSEILVRCNAKEFKVASGNTSYVVKDGVLYTADGSILVRYPMSSGSTSFSVPSSVTAIYSWAFYNADSKGVRTLRTVSVPEHTYVFVQSYAFGTANQDDVVLTIKGYSDSYAEDYYDENYVTEKLAWKTVKVTNYKVTFNPNKGSVTTKSKTVRKGDEIGSLPTPTRKGYYFVGWYTATSGGTKVTKSTTITKSMTLYARWAKPDLAKAKVKVADCTWNGKAQKPAVTVTLQGAKLKNGTDYSLSYANNKEPGTGKVTVTGIGKFKGTKKTAKFTIEKAQQTITAKSKTYENLASGTKKTLSVKVKGGATIRLTSNNTKVVKTAKSGCSMTFGEPGVAAITIKTAETAHYKAASKKVYVRLKGDQKISINGSLLTYNKTDKCYDLKSEVLNRSMGVYACDNAKITCRVWLSGSTNHPWIDSGDKLTVKGTGTFTIRVWTEETKSCPAAERTFTIRIKGPSAIKNTYQYRQLADGTISLEKWLGTTSKVTVPSSITLKNGLSGAAAQKSVTQIGNYAFSLNTKGIAKLMEVSFPDASITKIGKSAFEGCPKLEKVRLPINLTSLGARAFANCPALKDIEMPDKIKTLQTGCFDGCKVLGPNFYLPGNLVTIQEGTFRNCNGIKRLMAYGYLNKIDKGAFSGCKNLKHIYYSASELQWNAWSGGVTAEGNESFLAATKHYNAGAIGIYCENDISEESLYRDYPSYLTNENYEYVLNNLDIRLKEANAETPESKLILSVMKTQMQQGFFSYTLVTMFDDIYHMDLVIGEVSETWSEQKTNKALAQELILELSDTEATMSAKDEAIETTNSILEALKDAKDLGDCVFVKKKDGKIVKDNVARYRFAQKLSGCIPGDHRSELNDMLAAIQDNWDLITEISEGSGYFIDALDYASTVLILHEYSRAQIETLLAYTPEGYPLRSGLEQLKKDIDAPLPSYVEKLFREEAIKHISKTLSKTSGPTFEAAEMIYKVVSIFIFDTPTIDSYNKAWLSTLNAQMLHCVMKDKAAEIQSLEASDDRWAASDDYRLICSAYFIALRNASKYVAACNNSYDSAYLRQTFARYDDSLSYESYLLSCKEMLLESGNYQ